MFSSVIIACENNSLSVVCLLTFAVLYSPAKVCNENILTKKDEERNISALHEECMVD